MKRTFLLLLLIAASRTLLAQCEITPTVTPANPILCPGGTDTLWTEEYDTYQWLKGNNEIEGATNQYYVVTEADLLKKFKVEVTLDSCEGTSTAVLVDGWVFLLPYVIQTGDMGYYDPQLDANVLCHGDTMVLTMGLPYNVNVQWYDSVNPIPGATDVDLYVTENGSFTVCGAPEVCPNYTDCMLIPINVVFGGEQPTITWEDNALHSSEAESYQWYLNGDLIPGATNQNYEPTESGSYTVIITDQYNCSNVSEPYDYIATSAGDAASSSFFKVYPNPATDFLKIILNVSSSERQDYRLENQVGRTIFSGIITNEVTLDLSALPSGIYFLYVQDEGRNLMRKIIRQ